MSATTTFKDGDRIRTRHLATGDPITGTIDGELNPTGRYRVVLDVTHVGGLTAVYRWPTEIEIIDAE